MIHVTHLRPHYRGAVVPLGPFAFTGMRLLTLYPLPSGWFIPVILQPHEFETLQRQCFDVLGRKPDSPIDAAGATARRAFIGAAIPVGKQFGLTHSLILGSRYLQWRIAGEEVVLRQDEDRQAFFVGHRRDLEPEPL